MPIPPIIIPPHLLLPNPATLAAIRAAAAGAAAPGASSILAYVLAQNIYKQAPDWIREDESWQAFSRNKNSTDGNNDGGSGDHQDGFVDEMASLTAVIQKLEGLLVTGYDKLGSERRTRRRRNIVRRIIRPQTCTQSEEAGDLPSQNIDGSTKSKDAIQNENASESKSELQKHQKESTNLESPLLDDDDATPLSTLEWHAALLAYWQLCNQIRERYPCLRDDMYKISTDTESVDETQDMHNQVDEHGNDALADDFKANANIDKNKEHGSIGECLDIAIDGEMTDESDSRSMSRGVSGHCDEAKSDTQQQASSAQGSALPTNRETPIMSLSKVKELQTMLNFAIWAYEPNEELLRSLLLAGKEPASKGSDESEQQKHINGGYQLIVHRTTNYIDPNEDAATTSINNSTKKGVKTTKAASSKKAKRKPPGRVGYFVGISQTKKTLLIGMKGTSTLEELLTDCCGRAIRVDLDNDPHNHSPHDDVDSLCDEMCNEQEDGVTTNSTIEENEILISRCSTDYHSAPSEDNLLQVDAIPESKRSETDLCNDDELTDMVHITVDSVEVELLHERKAQAINGMEVAIDTSNSKSSPQTKPKKASIDKVPSKNVLLLSSLSTAVPQTLTDIAQPYTIEQSSTDEFMQRNGIEMEANRSHKLRGAHEGILHCAQQVLFEVGPLIEEYGVSKGFDVVCTGHSLGAGASSLLAVLIRGKYPLLTERRSSSLHGERVRAYAFAPPPVLDRSSALACRHYIISVVNNSDIIPRSSLSNLDAFLTILEAVRHQLMTKGMNPTGSNEKRNALASTMALFRKLSEGTRGDLLLDPAELQAICVKAMAEASLGDGEDDISYWDKEFGHHLFVPGKLLLMHETWSSFDSTTLDNKDSPAFNAAWTDGTHTPLKGFDLAACGGMATDHLTMSYERALGLIEQTLCA